MAERRHRDARVTRVKAMSEFDWIEAMGQDRLFVKGVEWLTCSECGRWFLPTNTRHFICDGSCPGVKKG